MKRRINTSYDDDVADRWSMRLDLRYFQSRVFVWDHERIGILMRLVFRTWLDQKHLPDSVDEMLAAGMNRYSLGVDLRKLRRHYDDEMKAAIRHLVKQRAPLYDGERERIFSKSGGVCFHCGGQITADDFHIDHLLAVANGGMTHRDNLVASCAPCNLSKGTKAVDLRP